MKIIVLEDTEDRRIFFNKLYLGHSVTMFETPEPMIADLENNTYDQIWLDHDLGGKQFMESGPDSGYAVALSMMRDAIHSLQKNSFVFIHSQNPPGAVRMYETLKEKYKVLVFPMTALYGSYRRML